MRKGGDTVHRNVWKFQKILVCAFQFFKIQVSIVQKIVFSLRMLSNPEELSDKMYSKTKALMTLMGTLLGFVDILALVWEGVHRNKNKRRASLFPPPWNFLFGRNWFGYITEIIYAWQITSFYGLYVLIC